MRPLRLVFNSGVERREAPITWLIVMSKWLQHITRLSSWSLVLLYFSISSSLAEQRVFDYQHGASYIESLKYPSEFKHFEYANPRAPKGGTLRFPELGTFDSFNNMVDKGRKAWGMDLLGVHAYTSDSLIEPSIDENASFYGRLADGIWISADYKEFAFRLREDVYWHDGSPLTIEDVIFSFTHYKDKASSGIRTALLELDQIIKISDKEVLFTVKKSATPNPNLPFAVGQFAIQSKAYWEDKDPTKTTIKPPLGSGPYRVKDFLLGRYVVYERVEDYWGKDLPVMKGRYNFNQLKCDYFRDESIMVESVKADVIDLRHETVSKQWMTQYNFPAREKGYFNRELIDLNRPWGMWWPIIWNVSNPKFQDIRVREALWSMYDFRWVNRVLMYGFYDYADSYFYNSPMAHQGLPSIKELELLEPFRGQVPERVFTHAWTEPESDGYGHNRDQVKRALELFSNAGYEIHDGVMKNVQTGEPFTIDFINVSTFTLRQNMPFVEALNRIGIETTARAPEVSNWVYRMQSGKFEGGGANYIPSNTPALALRNWFSSASADIPLSQNWMGIRNPAVDFLIEKVLEAKDPENFYAATRALDRVLLWNFYWIPGLAMPGYRLVYWNRFGQPDHGIRLGRSSWIDTWWWDPIKAARVKEGMRELSGES